MADEEDFRAGPLADRLVSAKWRVRSFAYEDLKKLFDEALEDTSGVFTKYAPFMKKILNDKNVVALENGLSTVLAWLDRASAATKHAGPMAQLLAEKTLKGRTTTKKRGQECILMLIEREAVEPTVSALMEATKHKDPKVAAASLETIVLSVEQFGAKELPTSSLLKTLPRFFEHKDKNVRASATALAVELYKWLGDLMMKQIEGLRPAQVNDLKGEFEKVEAGSGRASRFLRSKSAAVGGPSAEQEEEEAEEIDPYSMIEAANILPKLNGVWFERLESKKWKDRKEALDELSQLADTPKIASGDFLPVGRALKTVIAKDVNVMCVQSAAKAANMLALGLRNSFSSVARILFHPMILKLKENKPSVIAALQEALLTMSRHCFSLPEVFDELKKEVTEQKVPKIRVEGMKFLVAALETTKKRPEVAKHLKDIGLCLIRVLDDTNPEARDQAAKAFGALCGIVGERALQPYLSKLDDVRTKKVKECFPENPTAVVPVSAVASSSKPSSAKARKTATASTSPSVEEKGPSSSSSSSANIRKPLKGKEPSSMSSTSSSSSSSSTAAEKKMKATAPKRSAAAAKPTGKVAKAGGKSNDAPVGAIIDAEAALALLEENGAGDILTLISSKNWKERLAGVEKEEQLVQQWIKAGQIDQLCDAIVRQLSSVPGWKESNFQVNKGVFSILTACANACTRFSNGAAHIATKGAVERLGDVKVGPSACESLSVLAECVGPLAIIGAVCKAADGHKNPKVTSGALEWINTAVREFGQQAVDVKMIVNFCKSCLDSRNAAVRTSSITLLGTLRMVIGPAIRDFVGDVKPSQLKLIDGKFAESALACAPAPSRSLRGQAAAAVEGSAGGGVGGSLPREDISARCSGVVDKLGDKDWRVRKEGLNDVKRIIVEAHKLIGPKLGPLGKALKQRMSDSNKTIVPVVISVIADIASAMGPPFDRYIRLLAGSVLAALGDSNKKIVAAASECLDIITREVGLKPFLKDEYLPNMLSNGAAQGKLEAAAWANRHIGALSRETDVKPLIKPVLHGLEDRSPEVRRECEALLGEVMFRTSYGTVKGFTRDLRRASLLAITPILEKLRIACSEREGNEAREKLATQRKATEQQQRERLVATTSAVPPSSSSSQSSSSSSSCSSSSSGVEGKLEGSRRSGEKGEGVVAQEESSDEEEDKNDIVTYKPRSDKQLLDLPQEIATPAPDRSRGIRRNDAKNLRALEASSDEWNFRSLAEAEESVKQLKRQLKSIMTADVHRKLFSSDKDVSAMRSAVSVLTDAVKHHPDDVIDSLDLLLKWLSLQFFSTFEEEIANVVFQYALLLFVMLADKSYRMSEYEAQIFLPHLARQSGQFSETQRGYAFDMVRTMGTLYPASKICATLLKEIPLINKESQVFCVSQVSTMVRRYGLQICTDLPQCVRVIAAVEDVSAAASCLRAIRNGLQRTAESSADLEEMLKQCANAELLSRMNDASPAASAALSSSSSAYPPSCMSTPGAKRTAASLSTMVPSTPFTPASTLPPRTNAVAANTMKRWLSTINEGHEDQTSALSSLKDLRVAISSESVPPVYSDVLVGALTKQLQLIFEGNPSSRYTKDIVRTLIDIFSKESFAQCAGVDYLHGCITEALLRLQDPVVAELDDSSTILKELNRLVVKMLENSDRTLSFVVLLQLLREAVAASPPRHKFTDFVMKCLLKLTKTLKTAHHSMDLRNVALELHNFLEVNSPVDASGSMPFMTVKTIVSELLKVVGEDFAEVLALVPEDSQLRGMIEQMAKSHTKVRQARPDTGSSSLPIRSESRDSIAKETAVTHQHSNELEKKRRLTDIFSRLTTGATREQGLVQLQQYIANHPEVDLEPYLAKTSRNFRAYIERSLNTVSELGSSTEDADKEESVLVPLVPQQRRHQEQQCDEPTESVLGENNDPYKNGTANSSSLSKNMSVVCTDSSSSSSLSSSSTAFRERLRQMQRSAGLRPVGTAPPTLIAPSESSAPAVEGEDLSMNLRDIRARLEEMRDKMSAADKLALVSAGTVPATPLDRLRTSSRITQLLGGGETAAVGDGSSASSTSSPPPSIDELKARLNKITSSPSQ